MNTQTHPDPLAPSPLTHGPAEPLEPRFALAAFTGSVAAVFASPSGGTFTGEGTANFTWGEGADGSAPNSFAFTPAAIDAEPGEVFSLGQLAYFNGTTRGGTETGAVDLSLSLDFDRPARGGVRDTAYGLTMTSTPNTSDPVASADFVNLGTGKKVTVKLGRIEYALDILGFGSVSGGAPTIEREFHVQEGATDSADLLARFTPLDLIAGKLSWNPREGGLSFSYSIKGEDAPDQPLELYWASGPLFETRISAIDVSSVVLPLGVGRHSVHIPGSLLLGAPAGTTHLVAALDGMELITETRENNNVAAIADVQVTLGPRANGALSDYSVGVVKDLLRQAGESSVTVSSLQRTAEDQARVMFDNLVRPNGVANQLALYAPPGDAVIDVFVAETAGLSRAEIRAQRAAIEASMVAEINAQGPSNVSHHCADPSVLQVLDLAPSSFAATSRANFPGLVSGDGRVGRFLGPSRSDPAFHLEIGQI